MLKLLGWLLDKLFPNPPEGLEDDDDDGGYEDTPTANDWIHKYKCRGETEIYNDSSRPRH